VGTRLKSLNCLREDDGHAVKSTMPRYYFDVMNGHRLIDPAGVDCANDAEATRQAKFIAARIADEVPASTKRRLAVLNDERQEISVINIGDDDGSEQTGRRQRAQGRG
jgi:hypothetical protein